MTDQQRLSRSTCSPSHDVHSLDLDWDLTIAHQACSIATGFCFCNVPVDCCDSETGCKSNGGRFAKLSAVNTDKVSILNSRALVSKSHSCLDSSDVLQLQLSKCSYL
jgi:hypothetical protein